MEKAGEVGKFVGEVKIGEEQYLFSDNQFEGERLLLTYKNGCG
jgi:hypothetical protein